MKYYLTMTTLINDVKKFLAVDAHMESSKKSSRALQTRQTPQNLQNSTRATEASFCHKKTCDTALEPPKSIFSSFTHHEYVHTSGTHLAHRWHVQKMKIFKIFNFRASYFLLCHRCARCVPDVCTYL